MTAISTDTQLDVGEAPGGAFVGVLLGARCLTSSSGTSLRFQAIPDAPFGIEVNGIDWQTGRDRAIELEEVRLLTLALRRHQLLVLRGQPSPSEGELDSFLRRFGRLVLETEDGAAHYAGHRNLGGPASAMAIESLQYMERAVDKLGEHDVQAGRRRQSPSWSGTTTRAIARWSRFSVSSKRSTSRSRSFPLSSGTPTRPMRRSIRRAGPSWSAAT